MSNPPRKIVRLAAVVGLAAAVAWFLHWYGNRHDYFDLRIYMKAMRWWADGNPLYDYAQPDRVQGELYFTYPPFAALLLRPFVEISLGTTFAIFTIGSAVAVAVTTWWLVSPVAERRGLPRWYAAGLAIPFVFAIEPTRETIAFGQINMLLIVLILGDLLIAVPRNSRWAGVGIGLATALKLFPGIFIVYLLVTRRWRAAITASAAAAVATLLAAAVAPRDSWRFWTHELWATDRVGRTDYTGNQSLLGLLSRLTAPEDPSRLLWLALVALALGYGMWRAARAVRAGDEVAGLALTGLVAALISPITWPHHVYWFVPALVVLVDAGLPSEGRRVRPALLALAVIGYATIVYGVVSFFDWGVAPEPTDSVSEFVRRNAYVLLTVVLLAVLPARTGVPDYPRSAPKRTDLANARPAA
ncbi:glycosyltransferase family 87 protein [Phytohabitans aurantiacus]|uniref:glycosyltransferase family 87 protein n=1 Tax=Phytohabitans aurantiacus TaxID=3016789 RepID=UPI00248FE547|nr:glycosyltransferase family 87 protein [Phytohabitans aurantiacus]